MSLIGDAAGALTGNVGLYVAGALVAVGVSAFGVQTWRLHSAEAEAATERAAYATRETELTQRALAAEKTQREIEQQRAKDLQEIAHVAEIKIAAADAAASTAAASAASLRDRAQALAAAGRRACGNPATAGRGAAASDPIGLLADVLGRADARAGVLAATADRARIAGLACEQAYDSLRPEVRAQP